MPYTLEVTLFNFIVGIWEMTFEQYQYCRNTFSSVRPLMNHKELICQEFYNPEALDSLLQFAVNLQAVEDNTKSSLFLYMRNFCLDSSIYSTPIKVSPFNSLFYEQTVEMIECLGGKVYTPETGIPSQYVIKKKTAGHCYVQDKVIVLYELNSLWHEAVHFIQGFDKGLELTPCDDKGYTLNSQDAKPFEHEGFAKFFINYRFGGYKTKDLVVELAAFGLEYKPEVVMQMLYKLI
jgi:hypothetical protein